MSTYPGAGGWHREMQGDVEYLIVTVAGGHRAAYVVRNDVGEWVAGVYDRQGNPTVVGAGYPSEFDAELAADHARNFPG